MYDPVFEELWKAYPTRPGANKRAAYKAWQARVREGVDPQAMLVGVQAYAKYVRGSDPNYIKHPSTFLGPDRHFEADWRKAAPRTTAPTTERWSDPHAGRAGGLTKTLADLVPEVLAKQKTGGVPEEAA